jgi:predicted ATP-grasp superfamily ATP-dependent carboligase
MIPTQRVGVAHYMIKVTIEVEVPDSNAITVVEENEQYLVSLLNSDDIADEVNRLAERAAERVVAAVRA